MKLMSSFPMLGIATLWILLLASRPSLAQQSCIATTGYVTDVSSAHWNSLNCTKIEGNLEFEQELSTDSWLFWSTVTDITGSMSVSVLPDSWPFTSLVNVTDSLILILTSDSISRLSDEDGWVVQSVGTLNVTSMASNFTTINITLPSCNQLIVDSYYSSAAFGTLIVNQLASLFVLNITIQPILEFDWQMPELLAVTQFITYNILPSSFANIMVANETQAQVGALSITCADSLYDYEYSNDTDTNTTDPNPDNSTDTGNNTSNNTSTEWTLLGFNSVTWFGSISILGCNSSSWGDGSFGGGNIQQLEYLQLGLPNITTLTPFENLVNVTTYLLLDLAIFENYNGVFDSLTNVGTLHMIDHKASSCVFESLSFANAITIESAATEAGSLADLHFPSLASCSAIGLSGLASLTNFTLNNLAVLFTATSMYIPSGSTLLAPGVFLVSNCGLYDLTLPSLEFAGGINLQNNDVLNFVNFPALQGLSGSTGFIAQGCPLGQLLLPSCANVTGNIIVMNSNLTDLSLSSLVFFQSFILQSNDRLESFNFAKGVIIQPTGNVFIDNCGALKQVDALYWVKSIGGSIQVTNCESLVSTVGFCGAHYIDESLTIFSVPSVCTTALYSTILFTRAGGYEIDSSDNTSCTTGFNDFFCNCATMQDSICFDNEACANDDANGDINCFVCPANQFMESRSCFACGTHRASPEGSVGSDKCVCEAGYFGLLNQTCTECPIGTYKATASTTSSCTSCPAHSTTEEVASTSRSDCLCEAPYFGTIRNNGGSCRLCTAGSFCSGGANITECPVNCFCVAGSTTFSPCPANSGCPSGSSAVANCTCFDGFIPVDDNDASKGCQAEGSGSSSSTGGQQSSTGEGSSTGGQGSSTGGGGQTRSSTGGATTRSSTGGSNTRSSTGSQQSSSGGGGQTRSSTGGARSSSTGGGAGTRSSTGQQGGGSSGGAGSRSSSTASNPSGSSGAGGSSGANNGPQNVEHNTKRLIGHMDEKPTTSAANHASINHMILMMMVMIAAMVTRNVFIR